MSPILVNASEGQGEGLEQSPEEPGAQGVLSRAFPGALLVVHSSG